jgi:hypothetical protein
LSSLLSILASQWDDLSVSQLIEIIGPSLHHPDALGPVFGCVQVSAPDIIRFLVCKLTLDGVWIPARLVSHSTLRRTCQQLWRGDLGNGAQALLLPHPLAAPLLVLTAPRLEGRGGRGECDNLLDGRRRARHKISN